MFACVSREGDLITRNCLKGEENDEERVGQSLKLFEQFLVQIGCFTWTWTGHYSDFVETRYKT